MRRFSIVGYINKVKIQMGLHSYSQPSESEDIFGNDSHSGYSETEDLIRRDQAELSLSREAVVYPPQPEVEFGFPQSCYCGGQPHLATSTSRNDPGYIDSVTSWSHCFVLMRLLQAGLITNMCLC
ncbi:uncharacterized protein LOC108837760 [Raphanus sativus]|uniref:Uncharacterized protein LOC108837760 n=1 Tax=Raphanus sativus TaxID=3726 RepID=A0A9W3BX16_RAPSA|nr:uncharacterized protein LOC108837760 [Raphanus sativus]